MSAGGLSYSGLQTKRRVTLPSVEMWGSNMNILKDPPKGVYTRRVDKVGDTQNVLMETDMSGDRACEYIQVYARGVNPMVSVSYDNFGNNGGQNPLGGADTPSFYNRQVRYPYRVETLRPPILRQEDLLPYSRMPRVWFHAETNPEFPQFKQTMACDTQKSSTRDDERMLRYRDYHDTVLGSEKTVVDETSYSGHASKSDEDVLKSMRETATRISSSDAGSQWVTTSPSSGTTDTPLHAHAQSSVSTSTIQKSLRNETQTPTKEIERNRRIYEAFSQKAMPFHGQGNPNDPTRVKKALNPNMMFITAQTNNRLTRETPQTAPSLPLKETVKNKRKSASVETYRSMISRGSGGGHQSDTHVTQSSVVPTKRMLYKAVETTKSQDIHRDNNTRETYMAPENTIHKKILRPTAVTKKIGIEHIQQHDPSHQLSKKSVVEHKKNIVHDGTRTTSVSGQREWSDERQPEATRGSVHSDILHSHATTNQGDPRTFSSGRLDDRNIEHMLRGINHDKTILSHEGIKTFHEQSMMSVTDPSFVSRHLDRVVPQGGYQTASQMAGIERESSDRGSHGDLRRRHLLIENTTTRRSDDIPLYSDMYDSTVQTRTHQSHARRRLPMEGFLHNHSAVPVLGGTSHGDNVSTPVTDDRVTLRRRAFDTFMERQGQDVPPQWIGHSYP